MHLAGLLSPKMLPEHRQLPAQSSATVLVPTPGLLEWENHTGTPVGSGKFREDWVPPWTEQRRDKCGLTWCIKLWADSAY